MTAMTGMTILFQKHSFKSIGVGVEESGEWNKVKGSLTICHCCHKSTGLPGVASKRKF